MELKNAAIRQIIYDAQLKRHAENMALAKTITGKTDEQLTREVNGLVEKAKVLNVSFIVAVQYGPKIYNILSFSVENGQL